MSDKLNAFLAMMQTHSEIVDRVERNANATCGDVAKAKLDANNYFDREWKGAFMEMARIINNRNKE